MKKAKTKVTAKPKVLTKPNVAKTTSKPKATVEKKAKVNLKKHPVHLMKRVSSSIEDVYIHSYSMTKKQKRLVIRYVCSCKEEDVLYREIDKREYFVTQYTRKATR